jgi:hypothetical protein
LIKGIASYEKKSNVLTIELILFESNEENRLKYHINGVWGL